MSKELNEKEIYELSEILFSGRKIEAIKYYRNITQYGLKESKIFVDSLSDQLRKESPHKFKNPQNAGCGSTVAIILAIGYCIY
jgi:ribosomal protein L7/L12